MEVSPQQVAAGQAAYTRRNLNIYDLVVHGLSNPLIWRCPTQRLVNHYNRYVTANHIMWVSVPVICSTIAAFHHRRHG